MNQVRIVETGLKVANFGVRTLSGIDFHIPSGESMGLAGPSGAGKTLLLRALADLDPHQGQMWLDGTAATQIPVDQWRRQVGLLPAESAWWHDTVGPHFNGAGDDLLSAVGFGREVMSWQVSRLSSGERQRLALIRLLCMHPKVLLLDEPSANLDAENTLLVENLLNRYCAEHQPAVIWVSHDPGQLSRNCDRICVIQDGRLAPVEPSALPEEGV